MAIIYSYPTVIPTVNDLVLGTDVDQASKPTKNFTIQSIVDIVAGGSSGLGATIKLTTPLGDASDPITNANQPIINLSTISGTGGATFSQFTTIGGINISGTTGTGFTNITSTDFTGNLTGIVKAGSSIEGTVTGVTQAVGTSNTTLATTEFVANRVDPSILTFAGTTGGNQTVNLAAQTFSLLGTANQIESVSTAQLITFRFPAAGVTLPNGSVATTQLAADDSTKVATTAFVRNYDDLQDLDFTDGTTAGSVVLNSQSLSVLGTANQVITTAANQALTISLPATVIRNLQGNVTGTLLATSSIAGLAGGTDAQNVLGVTQTAGDDSTRLATTKYVDNASGAKTLDYAGDATGPFALNLSTDDLEFNGDSNITVTAAAVTGTKGIVTIDLDNDVTITGKMEAGTLSDGTFSGSTGTYTGGVSITSALFVGPLTGNASTATALADPGTIQLLSGSGLTEGVASGASTYTDGGNLSITTSLANTTVTSKTLLNLPSFTTSSIAATDTINQALAKLQGQINAAGGGGALAYEGAWRASVTAVSNGAVAGSVNLVITTADANLVKGTVVEGAGITGTVRIDAITGTAVTLDTAITIATGITLTMSPPGGAITGATAGTAASLTTPANKLSGRFYICDTVGKAEPNAGVPWTAATTPNEWAVGDWVVYISNGSQPDEWQKLDQSNELFGSGAATRVALWTASNTLGTGLIADDGATVTIGANGNLTVLGDTILGDDAAADTITLKGVTTFESTGRFKKGLALGTATDGSEYGDGTKVLTSSGASGTAPTWETPTTGTVEDVALTHYGDAFVVAVTDGSGPDVSIAITKKVGALATDYINGLGNITAFPVLDNYIDWKLQGDSGTNQDITKQTVVDFAGGTKITTATTADTLTINHDAQTNTPGTPISESPAFGGTFTAISAVPVDTTGHLTGQTVKTITIPANPDFIPSANGTDVGIHGLVPAPGAGTGSATYFLNGTGAFSVPVDEDGVTAVTAITPIISSGGDTPNITHATSGVAAGTYTSADITVNDKGHVTAASSGSGTYTFTGSRAFLDSATATNLFTLTKATTGTIMFNVMVTSTNAATESVCKAYYVARGYGIVSPPFNKIIDSGPDGSIDFAVTFVGDATTGVQVMVAATGAAQTISYSVEVGYDSEYTTVITQP